MATARRWTEAPDDQTARVVKHALEIQVNGRRHGRTRFDLAIPKGLPDRRGPEHVI